MALQAQVAQSPVQYEEDDLPAVDDMEIAARAAAGAPDPVGPILRKALGEETDEEEEEAGVEPLSGSGAVHSIPEQVCSPLL